jgi:hypothetical protein
VTAASTTASAPTKGLNDTTTTETVTCCGATLTIDAHAPATCWVCGGDLHQAAEAKDVIASMIGWLDEHQHDGMDPGIRAALEAEDPRTWAEVHAAGVVTDADVIAAWLDSQAALAGGA